MSSHGPTSSAASRSSVPRSISLREKTPASVRKEKEWPRTAAWISAGRRFDFGCPAKYCSLTSMQTSVGSAYVRRSILSVRRPSNLVEEHRRDPQVFARSDEVPLVEFKLRARQDFLDVREERQSAPPEELRALPRLLDRPPERLAGVRPARERVERSLEVLDRAGVIPFSDRPTGVAERDVGLVRVEAFALQTGVQDLRVRDAGRRLAVRIPDDIDLVAEAGGHRARGLDEAFLDHVSRDLDVGLGAVREDALAAQVRHLRLRRVEGFRRIEVQFLEERRLRVDLGRHLRGAFRVSEGELSRRFVQRLFQLGGRAVGEQLGIGGTLHLSERFDRELGQEDAVRGLLGALLERTTFLFGALDEDSRLQVIRHERAAVPDPGQDLLLRASEERLEFFRPKAQPTHRIDSRLECLRGFLISTEALVQGDRERLRFLRGVECL